MSPALSLPLSHSPICKSRDLSKDTYLLKGTTRENPCHRTSSDIKLGKRKLLNYTALGLIGGGLSVAQPARAEPRSPVESTSSRMTYSRFLQYLDDDAVKKVDLFENGTVAIAEIFNPTLDRIQRVKIQSNTVHFYEKQKSIPNVLLLCFTLCTVSYTSMAVLGYLMFGSEVQSQITLNLPTDKLSSKVAIYTTLVIPITKYALIVTPIVNATKSWFPSGYNKKIFGLVVSTSLVISTVIGALVIPFYADLMSLVGALLSVTASIIMPCLCYLKISGTYRKFGIEMAVLWGIVLMGVAVAAVGTYTSLSELIGDLKADEISMVMMGRE